MALMESINIDTVDDKLVGGLVGKWFDDIFKQQIIELCEWIAVGTINILSPFIEWGAKIVIIWCVITYYLSHDNKSISLALKALLIWLLFIVIKGAVL